MRCPNCNRIQRFTKKEKSETMEKGVMQVPCMNCGTIITVHKYDVDANEKRKHNHEMGICSNCGVRPVTEGYKTCEQCRKYQDTRIYKKVYEPAGNWFGLFQEKDKPLKQPEIGIDEVSKKAHEKGISYGDLVAIMEGRKKERKDLD